MARLVSFVLLAALISPASAGPCAIPAVVARPMTITNTVISPGGGVLVTLTFGGYGGAPNPKAHELEQKGWRFKAGGKLVAPVIKTLAPGLAVYELPDEGDAITLVDDTAKDLVAVKRAAAKLPELAAPTVKSIVHTVYVSRGPRGGGETRTIVVNLASPPPADARALILYYAAGNAPTGAASWVSVIAVPGTEHVLYSTPGRCALQIPGMTEIPVGGRAMVAWVDASGRVSAKSKESVVVKGKPPVDPMSHP